MSSDETPIAEYAQRLKMSLYHAFERGDNLSNEEIVEIRDMLVEMYGWYGREEYDNYGIVMPTSYPEVN